MELTEKMEKFMNDLIEERMEQVYQEKDGQQYDPFNEKLEMKLQKIFQKLSAKQKTIVFDYMTDTSNKCSDLNEFYYRMGLRDGLRPEEVIEGLERLIRNDYQFTIGNKSRLLMDEIQEDDDNILSFLESTGYIGLEKDTHATSKDLYVAYCRWCNDNLDVPVSERSFARRFKERSADYGMTYDKNISVGNGRHCRGFRGVHVKVRTKDVNY